MTWLHGNRAPQPAPRPRPHQWQLRAQSSEGQTETPAVEGGPPVASDWILALRLTTGGATATASTGQSVLARGMPAQPVHHTTVFVGRADVDQKIGRVIDQRQGLDDGIPVRFPGQFEQAVRGIGEMIEGVQGDQRNLRDDVERHTAQEHASQIVLPGSSWRLGCGVPRHPHDFAVPAVVIIIIIIIGDLGGGGNQWLRGGATGADVSGRLISVATVAGN